MPGQGFENAQFSYWLGRGVSCMAENLMEDSSPISEDGGDCCLARVLMEDSSPISEDGGDCCLAEALSFL